MTTYHCPFTIDNKTKAMVYQQLPIKNDHQNEISVWNSKAEKASHVRSKVNSVEKKLIFFLMMLFCRFNISATALTPN